MGNMAYWGGPVQVHPRVYLVYLGWGRPGAFDDDCTPVRLVEGRIRATLKCDPDGAGKRMADFVQQLGGTEWAGLQSQYYQVVNGVKTYIHNDRNQLGGIWVDDTTKTSAKISYRDMAVEADRARKHFGIRDLINANVVILQPKHFSDPKAQSVGYCAWHDIIEPPAMPSEFKGLKPGLPFTNMPYVLNQGDSCGAHLINSGPAGKLDGFTLALGHEIEEAVTDPGAEDRFGETVLGGWFDPFDANENGDKCAYVGMSLTGGSISGFPGRGGNIRGNAGGMFPVQSLWSNEAAGGTGYCAGAGSDLPF
jgi:serine protease